MPGKHYKMLIVSDAHFGQKYILDDLLYEFLSHNTCDHLVLNGDLIDGEVHHAGWGDGVSEMSRRVLDLIHARAAKGTKVTYITGNHDESLRGHNLHGANVNGIHIRDSLTMHDGFGRRLLLTHGDAYNPPALQRMVKTKWGYVISHCAKAFNMAARLTMQAVTGVQYSPVTLVRAKLDGMIGLAGEFEKIATAKANAQGYEGVVCGHIHARALSIKDGFFYANSGDWVENATALAVGQDGQWSLIDWTRERVNRGLKTTPSTADPNPHAAFRPLTQALIGLVHRIPG